MNETNRAGKEFGGEAAHEHDGIDRRGFLKCMAWAGTGAFCVMNGGVLKSYSLSQLPPQDLHAIAVYLKSIPARENGPSLSVQQAALAGSTFAAPGGSAGPATAPTWSAAASSSPASAAESVPASRASRT